MNSIRCASVVAFALIATSAASAGVVDITYSGIASGSWLTGIYAGQTFTNKAFSIHSSYLTDAITTYSQGYKATNGAADVTVDDWTTWTRSPRRWPGPLATKVPKDHGHRSGVQLPGVSAQFGIPEARVKVVIGNVSEPVRAT